MKIFKSIISSQTLCNLIIVSIVINALIVVFVFPDRASAFATVVAVIVPILAGWMAAIYKGKKDEKDRQFNIDLEKIKDKDKGKPNSDDLGL